MFHSSLTLIVVPPLSPFPQDPFTFSLLQSMPFFCGLHSRERHLHIVYMKSSRLVAKTLLSRLSNVQPVIGLPVKVTGTREDAIFAGDCNLLALSSTVGQVDWFFFYSRLHDRSTVETVHDFRLVRFNSRHERLLPASVSSVVIFTKKKTLR